MIEMEIVDLLANLVIKASGASIEEMEIRDEISSYIIETREYSIISTISSSENFEIATKYLLDDFIDDVKDRTFSKNPKGRQADRQAIVDKCIERIKPKSKEEKQAIYDYVMNAIDIVRKYYKNNSPIWARTQAEDVVEAINDRIDKLEDTIISNANIKNVKTQKEIEDDIGRILHNASYDHPLKQYYKTNYKNGKLFSEPISDEALKKFPPNIKLKGKIKIDNKYIDNPTVDILNYSYNHQKKFVVEVNDAESYLGEIRDIYQGEAENFIGKDVVFSPKEFPPAVPCSIGIDENVFFEYVLLGVTEILEDNTYIISNSKQSSDYYFEIKTTFKRDIPSKFYFKLLDYNKKNVLKIKEFLKAVNEGHRIIVRNLESGEPLISSKAETDTEITCWDSIDEEIRFLKSLCAIEEWFDEEVFVPNELLGKDINAIMELGNIIRGHKLNRTWDKFRMNLDYSKELNDKLCNINVLPREYLLKTMKLYCILGKEYSVPVCIEYQEGYIEDFSKVKKIMDCLDDDDSFSLILKAGNNNKCTISLYYDGEKELKDNELIVLENTGD